MEKEAGRSTCTALILHERLGHSARQLRPRLHDRPIRWFETRSREDLSTILTGLACPVVLIDLGQRVTAGLLDVSMVRDRVPDAWVLVLDSESHREVPELAREFGATHVYSGFVPPPVVADLIARWVEAAAVCVGRLGWSRTTFPKTDTDPWSWLNELLDPDAAADGTAPRGWTDEPDATLTSLEIRKMSPAFRQTIKRLSKV